MHVTSLLRTHYLAKAISDTIRPCSTNLIVLYPPCTKRNSNVAATMLPAPNI